MSEPADMWLVLPRDVALLPVSEITDQVGDRLRTDAGDFALFRPRSRAPSAVIDSDAAALLEEFRSPRTILEAVLTFSAKRQLEPHPVLDRAHPFLKRLRSAGLLVAAADNASRQEITPGLSSGEEIGSWRVERCLQSMEDAEVYLVGRGSSPAALKLARDEAGQGALGRELAALQRLAGSPAPALREQGTWEGMPYLAMEWIEGLDVDSAAAQRAGDDGALHGLALSIIDTYASLHSRSVLHGDVHPRNLLVEPGGGVRAIDFGFARLMGTATAPPPRGAVPEYYEPEFAAAWLGGERAPAITERAEQYQAALLVFRLLAGRAPWELPLERDLAFELIAATPPSSFEELGARPWPEVEKPLRRALAKDPQRRYPSMREFGQALGSAGTTPRAAPRPRSRPPADVVSQTITRLGSQRQVLDVSLEAPRASLHSGAAGIAYFFYRLACLRDDPMLLATADLWAYRAERECGAARAFYSEHDQLREDVLGPMSVLHTSSGVHWVRALVDLARGDSVGAAQSVDLFIVASGRPWSNPDVALGRAGAVLAAASLVELLEEGAAFAESKQCLLEHGRGLLSGVWEQIKDAKRVPAPAELTSPGIAHGWAGILYSALRWRRATGDDLPLGFAQRLDQLAGWALPATTELDVGKSSPDGGIHWAGWCNGSAGFVHLWAAVAEELEDDDWLIHATRHGWHAWSAGRRFGDSLCCGAAGQVYALLRLFTATGESEWLERAQTLGREAVSGVEANDPARNSLFRGSVGVAAMAADLERPASASMPVFEAEMPHTGG